MTDDETARATTAEERELNDIMFAAIDISQTKEHVSAADIVTKRAQLGDRDPRTIEYTDVMMATLVDRGMLERTYESDDGKSPNLYRVPEEFRVDES